MFDDCDRWEGRNAVTRAETMEIGREEQRGFEDENDPQMNSLAFDRSAIDDPTRELEETKKTLKRFISEVAHRPRVDRGILSSRSRRSESAGQQYSPSSARRLRSSPTTQSSSSIPRATARGSSSTELENSRTHSSRLADGGNKELARN